jgi:molybdopterin molybdotransferase
MLNFEEARRHFTSVARVLECEEVPLESALGRVLVEPIVAPQAVPPFDTSAMDGYALYVDDTFQCPYRLPVCGEAPAGAPPGVLRAGTACRIFTGAAVPKGANAVVMQESVERRNDEIYWQKPITIGQNIRRRGEDLEAKGLALASGKRIHTGTLSLASFLDRATLVVSRAPKVTILCTGSELRDPGTEPLPGSIPESNSSSVAALARQAGAIVINRSRVVDDPDVIRSQIESALVDSDVLVTIGGVSVGDYDYVRPALEQANVVLELYQVGIKPGKPIALGRRGQKLVVGLPGNPASAILTFALFGMPLLRAMQNEKEPFPIPNPVTTGAELKADPKRTRIVLGNRTWVDDQIVFIPHVNQSSGTTIALGQSEGFAIVPPTEGRIAKGATLPFYRWSDL